jgi:hypothetical protein
MPSLSLEQAMARARGALDTPTLYWLGLGGQQHVSHPMPARPGQGIDVRRRLAEMQANHPEQAIEYLDGLAKTGLTIEQLPHDACDCSGFVTWALGFARSPSPIGDVNTDAMHRDARGAQKLFVRLEQARVGALLVYPRQGPKPKQVGHVGFISEVDGQGRATRVIHCAPENFLIEPAAGSERNAIAETGTDVFDRNASGPEALRTMVVLYKAQA